MFIVFFSPSCPIRELALRELVREVNKVHPELRLRLVRTGDSSREVLTELGLQGRFTSHFWGTLQKSPLGLSWSGDTLLARRIIVPSRWVIGTTSLSAEEKNGLPFIPMIFCLTLFFCFLVSADFHPSSVFDIHPVFGTVRFKLVAALLYTTGVPLLIMGITAHSFLRNRELVAKAVQESLFPAMPLTSFPYSLYGNCVTASQVGGDYFDYTLLPSGHLRFIIGDVSGYGVGAALVVAMAKALMNHPDTSPDPEQILIQLNATFLAILKKKKIMSALVALFNPASRELRLTNAGHCYPMLVRNGTASFLEANGFPLGSTKLWKPKSLIITLNPDDMVVFYTDGLVEGQDRAGNPIGFPRFMADLPGHLSLLEAFAGQVLGKRLPQSPEAALKKAVQSVSQLPVSSACVRKG
ncbi:MAG: PP2C family protein-serine/threonine phosphatase [Candidatus Ozemobacteraceae bacterium]